MRDRLAREMDSHVYSRGNNPTCQILRKKLAALEGAEDALVFSSGSAAVAASVIALLQAGDHVVCVAKPYGWTRKLFSELLSRFNVTVSYVDGTKIQNFVDALQPQTRMIFLESPNSWTFELQDLRAVAALAKEKSLSTGREIFTLIDNSCASPLGQKPLAFGIDLSIHSATKYISGHSDCVAGAVCGSRKLMEKIFTKEFMTLGAVLSAHDAALLIRGLRTIELRLQRSSQTTREVVNWLAVHPKVKRLLYPFHKSHPQFDLAQKQMTYAGGLFTLELDSEKSVEKFCERSKAFLMAVSWGGYESLFLPAMGMSGSTSGQLLPIGLSSTMIRFYVGLEDPQSLIEDLQQSLE
jgi:cystathionine beta-lyase/cystathionine gamma-synthase